MKRISIDSLCAGELDEKIQRGLAEIGLNCVDPNTDHKKTRKLTLVLTFKPNDPSRQSLAMTGEVKVSLAPAAPVATTMLLGQNVRTGEIEMQEYGSTAPPVAHYSKIVGEVEGEEIAEPQAPLEQKGPIDLRKGGI